MLSRAYRTYFPKIFRQINRKNPTIPPDLREDLKEWQYILSKNVQKKVERPKSATEHILYADASGTGGLGGVLVSRRNHAWVEDVVAARLDPRIISSWNEEANSIYILEIEAIRFSLRHWRHSIKGSNVMLFTDNEATQIAVIRGASRDPEANDRIR